MTTVEQTLNGPFSPPPCSAAYIDPLLNEDHANAVNPAPEPARCRFLSSDKRQCRMLRADHHPDFCLYHAARQEEIFALLPEREFALAPELEALAADLTTATGVNRALGQVFRLLAQNRITRKDAVAFGYLGQLLLQTVDGVRAESVAAFGYKAWTSQLRSTLSPQPAESPDTAACEPQATPSTLSSRASSARASGAVASNDGSLGTGPAPEKPSPRDTSSANPADSAAPANPSGSSAFSPPNYADLLSRSLDLFDRKYDATPEGRREARALLLELELMAPREPKPPSKRLGVPYEPFPKPKGTRAVVIEHLRQQLHARSAANAPQSTVTQNAAVSPLDCALTDH